MTRIGGAGAPHPVEVLNDIGSADTIRHARICARKLGSKPFVTSPQSNGISEALVDTYGRDSVQLKRLQDARPVLASIGASFDDGNGHDPSSWLRTCSPREFIAVPTATAYVSDQTGA